MADFQVVDWMVGRSPSRKWRRRQRRVRRECHLRRARFRHQQLSDCEIVGIGDIASQFLVLIVSAFGGSSPSGSDDKGGKWHCVQFRVRWLSPQLNYKL